MSRKKFKEFMEKRKEADKERRLKDARRLNSELHRLKRRQQVDKVTNRGVKLIDGFFRHVTFK